MEAIGTGRISKIALVVVGIIMLCFTVYGTLREGFGNFAINVGVEGLVTLTALAIIGPLVRNVQEGTFHLYQSLNYERFIERAERARDQVQIYTTFTPLLQKRNKYPRPFLEILPKLLSKGVFVKVLLLHPDSLSVPQRQREIAKAGESVTDGIHDNIRVLSSFIAKLSPEDQQRISVRIYDASVSIVMHRWDDRALISFLPTDRLAEEGEHLEIDMRSSLGRFVESRVDELWNDSKTISLADYMTIRLTFPGHDEIVADYVTVDGNRYVDSQQIIATQARYRKAPLRVSDGTAEYDVDVIGPDDGAIQQRVVGAFLQKCGRPIHTVVLLVPAAE